MEKKLTLLLVDDDIDVLYQLKVQLENKGYNIITAESLHEAEDLLKETKPNAAVIDLMMEDEDSGFSLAYKIKQIDNKIPVIMITAVTSETGILLDSGDSESRSWMKAVAVL